MPPKPGATLEDKRSHLQDLLKAATAEKVQKCLLESVPNASVTQVDALSALLGSLSAAASKRLHCVRCHRHFFEHENNSRACRIPHHDDGDGERTEVGDDAITITESCCGIAYDSECGPPTKYCIVAMHTTSPDEVVYYDEEEDDGEGNRFVVTCAAKGCKKLKRKKVASETVEPDGNGKKKLKTRA